MSNSKRIPGAAGTLTPTGTAPQLDPTPPPTPENPSTTTTTATSPGRVVHDGENYFLIWGNNRIPIENVNALPTPTRTSNGDSTVGSALQNAIEVATQSRTALLA